MNKQLRELKRWSSSLPIVVSLMLLISTSLQGQNLEKSFKSPPDSARPYTWWHWVNGNVSKEGITKDLEVMKSVGIGGFQLFDAGVGVPAGSIKHNSKAYHDMVAFAFSEADRLGLKAGFNNCSGWSSSGGPWIKPENSMKLLVWSETQASVPDVKPLVLPKGDFRGMLPKKRIKTDFYRDIAVLAFPTPRDATYRIKNWLTKGLYDHNSKPDTFIPDRRKAPAEAIISTDSVINLTGKMKADGTLDWTPKTGSWTVVRFGYRSTGAINKPAAFGGEGLEVDKLSRTAVAFHWKTFVDRVINDAKGTSSLTEVLIDSYEVGMQNWTEGFAKEFKKRRGYDLIPMMVALTGRIVNDTETTDRVLWDQRVTVAELMHENYFGYFKDKCRELGLKYAVEPYGSGTFDAAEMTLMADVPMTEFWQRETDRNLWTWTSQIVSSGAHLSGNPIVGAEAFTSLSGDWTMHPGSLKRWGDRAFVRGVNRYYFHTFAHQPFDDSVKPGMTFSKFGGNFHRNNTWFTKSRGWMDYVTRCQFLMQSGSYQADILVLYGDERGFNSFIGPGEPPDMKEIPGFNFDLGGMGSLEDLSVDDGGVIRVTRNGKLLNTGYQVLLLKRADLMLPEHVEILGKLADQGARIFAPKPLRSPSYTEHKKSDRKLKALLKRYWDTGLIKSPDSFDNAVAKLTKDCELDLPGGYWSEERRSRKGRGRVVLCEKALFNHHKIGENSFYLLSNQETKPLKGSAIFRVSGKQPEFWNPLTGEIRNAPNWKAVDAGRTKVEFDLAAGGTVFVAFRKPTSLKEKRTSVPKTKELMTLNTDWTVAFDPKWGPANPVEFDRLTPWNVSDNNQIKYYSGSAVYRKTFTLPKVNKGESLMLDLGQVDVMARVKLNGNDLGLLWCPPFQVDIGKAAKPGENRLEIEVTNLWINRIIGDAAFPYDTKAFGRIQGGKPLPAGHKRRTYQYQFPWMKYPKRTDKLRPSGLAGPVVIHQMEALSLDGKKK